MATGKGYIADELRWCTSSGMEAERQGRCIISLQNSGIVAARVDFISVSPRHIFDAAAAHPHQFWCVERCVEFSGVAKTFGRCGYAGRSLG